jgi:hypothetical protein
VEFGARFPCFETAALINIRCPSSFFLSLLCSRTLSFVLILQSFALFFLKETLSLVLWLALIARGPCVAQVNVTAISCELERLLLDNFLS